MSNKFNLKDKVLFKTLESEIVSMMTPECYNSGYSWISLLFNEIPKNANEPVYVVTTKNHQCYYVAESNLKKFVEPSNFALVLKSHFTIKNEAICKLCISK